MGNVVWIHPEGTILKMAVKGDFHIPIQQYKDALVKLNFWWFVDTIMPFCKQWYLGIWSLSIRMFWLPNPSIKLSIISGGTKLKVPVALRSYQSKVVFKLFHLPPVSFLGLNLLWSLLQPKIRFLKCNFVEMKEKKSGKGWLVRSCWRQFDHKM